VIQNGIFEENLQKEVTKSEKLVFDLETEKKENYKLEEVKAGKMENNKLAEELKNERIDKEKNCE